MSRGFTVSSITQRKKERKWLDPTRLSCACQSNLCRLLFTLRAHTQVENVKPHVTVGDEELVCVSDYQMTCARTGAHVCATLWGFWVWRDVYVYNFYLFYTITSAKHEIHLSSK